MNTTLAAWPLWPTSPAAATTRSSAGASTALLRPRAPRCPRRRGQHRRRRRHPDPGPRRVPAQVVDFDAAASRGVRGRHRVPAHGRRAAAAAVARHRGARRRGEPAGARLARVPTNVDGPTSAPAPARRCRRSASCSSPRRRQPDGRDRPAGLALERRTYCLRKRAEHETGTYFPSPVAAHARLQGHARRAAARGFLPRPRRRAGHQRAGAGALPVLDQHVPVLVAGPPLPLRRAQRRDQHPARQPQLDGRPRGAAASDLIPGDLQRLSPIVTPDASDSATFDEVLELLHLGGRSLPHAVLMMIPEAWENHGEMDPARRAFYEFHSTLMEPWDGPALVTFTDGTVIGAVLDRNGLRPARYWVTEDGLVVLASEVGVLDVPPAAVIRKGRLEPGRMFLVDTAAGPDRRRRRDQGRAGRRAPVRGLAARRAGAPRRPARRASARSSRTPRSCRRQQAFGYTEEELQRPPQARWPPPAPSRSARWATTRRSPSSRSGPRSLYDYFTQLFAQVTNPPLDAIREELVTSLHLPARLRAEPARAGAGELPQGDPAVPGAEQRRARQDHPHQRRRGAPRLRLAHRARRLPGVPGVAPACSGGSPRSPRRSRRRSRTAPGSSCCPAAASTRTTRRSRRCCWPARCTSTWSGSAPAPGSG